mmetsp:Transcript_43293/g.106919  ORF Transcript_43293/g.106919 Transcript_43293/m.106919 type:complete len:236 (+) Transcript_43293:1869-2576(+)
MRCSWCFSISARTSVVAMKTGKSVGLPSDRPASVTDMQVRASLGLQRLKRTWTAMRVQRSWSWGNSGKPQSRSSRVLFPVFSCPTTRILGGAKLAGSNDEASTSEAVSSTLNMSPNRQRVLAFGGGASAPSGRRTGLNVISEGSRRINIGSPARSCGRARPSADNFSIDAASQSWSAARSYAYGGQRGSASSATGSVIAAPVIGQMTLRACSTMEDSSELDAARRGRAAASLTSA